jgi:hypothetical protein
VLADPRQNRAGKSRRHRAQAFAVSVFDLKPVPHDYRSRGDAVALFFVVRFITDRLD